MNFNGLRVGKSVSAGALLAFLLSTTSATALADDLKEPLTLSSENGVLNILMVAKAAPVNTLAAASPGGKAPTGWVYEICKKPIDGSNMCPASGPAPNYYGGTLLRLQAGDTLKIHFINKLPPVFDSDHSQEPGHEFLTMNPTNLHTHGMLVSPNKPTAKNPTYGDNVFVLTFNSANGVPVASPHMHSDIRMDYTDYEIKVPATHPSGLFWFHPHAHGLALNQISSGLSGLITVGDPSDYVCRNRFCASVVDQVQTRHMILKDMQVLPDGKTQDQEDPDFCPPTRQHGEGVRSGSCAGDMTSDSYVGGKWFFTINGQVNPNIPVKVGGGELWRITNASGSNTYDLKLKDDRSGREMLMQVVSIDGVSVSPTSGGSKGHFFEMSGGKFVPENCPGALPGLEEPICTRKLHMMPSSRAEVWVTYRDARDYPSVPPPGATATLRDDSYTTGPSGDTWPAVNLASVQFRASGKFMALNALSISGEAPRLADPVSIAANLSEGNAAVESDSSCKALPPGHMRRIFYGVPTDNPDAFGLAYEEVDEHGNVVGEAATDVEPFDPMKPTVCVPLGAHNTPVTERWQLVNVATEDHNFHIHQTKFRVLTKDELDGSSVPRSIVDSGIMMDNLPLSHADGVCGNNPPGDLSNPIADWRAGLCHSNPVVVEIPFAIAGDFVYHCHILEHEDGGMMARIRVRPTRK